MNEPASTEPRRARWAWVWALLVPVAMIAAVLLIQRGLGGFGQLQGSTEAWILAHVQRVLTVGDYAAATGVSMIPNTTWNSLFPALVAGISALLGASPVSVGQAVSAAALGLAVVALGRCWWSAGGAFAGLAGALALLFPPVVITASMARYDMLALALVLCVGWAVIAALERDSLLAWGAAGLLAGLCFNTREFMLAPAVGALAAGLVVASVAAWRRGAGQRRPRRLLLALLCLLAGLAVGWLPLPLALGLHPFSGLHATGAYALHNRFGDQVPLTTLLYLDRFGWAFGVGASGLAVAVLRPWRGGQRRAVLVLLGMLLPFVAFLFSRQQSPQYYLLAHVLVLSGGAGLVGLLPWRWARPIVLVALAAPVAPWTLGLIHDGLDPFESTAGRLHTEAWPADVGEPGQVMGWALDRAEGLPVVVISGSVENLDALARLEHGRPVAFLFQQWIDRLPEAVSFCGGQDVLVLSVEAVHQPPNAIPGGLSIERLETAHLKAEMWVVPGRPPEPSREHPCARGGQIRGACLQQAWLEGGDPALEARVLSLHDRFRGLQGWRAMWW
jgi:hypothetical protein